MLHNLKLRPMNEVIYTMTEHGSTLDTLVTTLNALPTPFAESHPQLSQDTRASQQCHPLLLHTFRPIVTTGDGNYAFNALSLTLTGSQQLSSLIHLLSLHALIKYRSSIIDALVDAYPDNSTHQSNRLYCDSLHTAVNPYAWGTDVRLFALSLFFHRPIFQYNTLYFNPPNSTQRESTLSNTRDVHHFAERSRNCEQPTRTHILCDNTTAIALSEGDTTNLQHPPLTLGNIGNVHWVAMLPLSPCVLNIPIPTTRILCE